MAVAFSTPFWLAIAGASVVAAGVAYLARPSEDGRATTSAPTLAAIDRNIQVLADVPLPSAPDDAAVGAPAAAQEFGGAADFSIALERHTAEMRARGESDADVAYLRKQFVEHEGGKSVLDREQEQHDARRQAWELRHPAFIRQRNEIFSSNLEAAERQQQLDALLHQHFTPVELDEARSFAGI